MGVPMYNLTVHAQQTVFGTVVTMSLSETDDSGGTSHLASCSHTSTDCQDLPEDPLWIFLEQVHSGFVKCLSRGEGRVWSTD